MPRLFLLVCLAISLILHATRLAVAQNAKPEANSKTVLVLSSGGLNWSTVVVSPKAGEWEAKAAADLAHYIGEITGSKTKLVNTAEGIQAALADEKMPYLFVGQVALDADPSLKQALAKVAKPNPVLRADAIVLKRVGNRVYLAGTNDDSHYYAVSELLHRWGCRWYLPGPVGECVPTRGALGIEDLDYAYAPPFEVRRYWISWNGETTGKAEFMRRNFFNDESVPSGHALGQYTKELIPPGKSMFNVPISEDRVADHVAPQVLPRFAKGEHVMLGMEDGVYESDSPADKELIALQYDKYFLTQSYTDAFLIFYNKVADRLMKGAPNSKAKIGFLAYGNITLPPVRDIKLAKPLVVYLAPIDIDPIHGMDSPLSAPRHELKDMLYKWAKVSEGRLVIYDYDQGMLVWRDIPNPSHQAFRQDVKHYQKAGILGVDTESRGAFATTFTNLHFRGQLLWNPELDVDARLAEFYAKYYGPAAEPMGKYWNAIYKAWDESVVTEHEYFVAPAIYTPELVAELTNLVTAADALVPQNVKKSDAESALYRDRMKIALLAHRILRKYMQMTTAAATDVDYAGAVDAGEKALATREELTTLDPTFTTYKRIGEHGYAWFPGEVQQYKELIPFTDGTKGTLVAKLPLAWNFRRDEKDVGVKEGWFKQAPDLAAWRALKQPVSLSDRQANSGNWEEVRSDVYLQAQGVITKDYQSYTGHGWYQCEVDLTADQAAGNVHVKFPGLFNECWLYVNGVEVAHRPFKGVWWMNDYRFEWDVDLAGKLQAGKNTLVVRINNPHHFGGMFRRPFLYRAK